MPIENLPPGEKSVGFNISSQDVADRVATLHEGGFSEEEIDSMMTRLNDEWAEQKLKKIVDEEIELMKKDFPRISRGKKMTPEQEKELRRVVLERLRYISKEDLEKGVRFKK